MATQVLNFGLSAPIDIQIDGPPANADRNAMIARRCWRTSRRSPARSTCASSRCGPRPTSASNVDRTLASRIGVTQREVASDLLISLSSSNMTSPNFWLDPRSGVNYNVMVQTPQYRVDSISSLENTPVLPITGAPVESAQLLGNLATVSRGTTPANATHYNIFPTADVQLSVQGTDLGRVAADVQKVVDRYQTKLPRGSRITLRGQIDSMRASFTGLGYGLIFAVLLVYLLMVINFQSWLDPLIILMALPGAAAGILWMLFATSTTISVPALMGAIMSIGVATANSILMITFANDQRKKGFDAHDAALTAGMTRLRPVMMTALAMIIGMLPMSLGLGEGGEQNAPLGRAVIGGLVMATFATLFFVPVVYSLLRRRQADRSRGGIAVTEETVMDTREEHGGEHDEHSAPPTNLPRIGVPIVAIMVLLLGGVLAALFMLGWMPREAREKQLMADAESAASARPVVDIVMPRRTAPTTQLTLPADAHANQETAIYPRANGYLVKLGADVGKQVGDHAELAEIDTPELDADLKAAEAAKRQADANAIKAKADLALATKTHVRYQELFAKQLVTPQDLDEKTSAMQQSEAAAKAAEASVGAAQSQVDRLTSLQKFEKVYAPFAGTITAQLRPGLAALGLEYRARQGAVSHCGYFDATDLRQHSAVVREHGPAETGGVVHGAQLSRARIPREGGAIDRRHRPGQPHHAVPDRHPESRRPALPRHVRPAHDQDPPGGAPAHAADEHVGLRLRWPEGGRDR